MSGGLPAAVYRRPVTEPQGALVLFHGRGTDEHDLAPLLEVMDPDRQLLGVTPRGPLALPPGGAHWYVVREVGYPDRATFDDTYARVSEWLEGLAAETGIPIDRTVLGGFSQGAVMSYALGLGRGRPAPAGIIALSGFIPEVEGFELDLESRRGLPVAVGHGTFDPVITVGLGRAARARLEAAGLPATYRESPMQHSVDPAFVADLRAWLSATLPAPPGRAAPA